MTFKNSCKVVYIPGVIFQGIHIDIHIMAHKILALSKWIKAFAILLVLKNLNKNEKNRTS